MISAELLSDLESCQRRGYFSRDWLPRRLHPTEITRRAIYASLSDSTRQDKGERAGEEVMALCADVGLDVTGHNLHDVGLHHAAIADLVATFIHRRVGCVISVPQDKVIGNHLWVSSCLMAGQRLLRVVLVDYISDERMLSESRCWYSMGEVAVYDAPMDVHVIALGNSRDRKRHSAWTKGLLHPRNRQLRFKKQAQKVEGFKESWIPIWREDNAQISCDTWLKQMQADDVFRDTVSTFKIERLPEEKRQEVRAVIMRKADSLSELGNLPDPSYSQCDWPRPCAFRSVCFAPTEMTPSDLNFRPRQQLSRV